MKITFILPYAGLAGGIRVAAIYARKLNERGHDVTVVSQPPNAISIRQRMKSILKGRGWERPAAKTPLLDFLGNKHVILNSARPVGNDDIPDGDVIIATWWETAEWVAALDASKGKKFYLLQDYEVFPYLPVQRVIDTFGLPLKKIAVSRYISVMLKENHNINDIRIIHNAVDCSQFNCAKRSKNNEFTVGFMYTSAARKKIELALNVIKKVKQKNDAIKVVAFGSRYPENDHRLPEWVEYYLRPDQEVIPKIYAQCDVWLFTSEAEGFGLPLLEAMACRTPVIATHAGAAADIIDNSNGVLVPTDVEAFVKEIERFGRMSEDTWLTYSQRAYETAQSYSWDDAADLFEAAILDVQDTHSTAPP